MRGDARERLADLDAGHVRGDRLELAADLGRGFGLDVPHVLVRRAAAEEDVDDAPCAASGGRVLGFAAASARRCRRASGRGPERERADPEEARRVTPSQNRGCDQLEMFSMCESAPAVEGEGKGRFGQRRVAGVPAPADVSRLPRNRPHRNRKVKGVRKVSPETAADVLSVFRRR